MMNGIGGDIMTMIWHNASRKLYGYNGSGRSPKVSLGASRHQSSPDPNLGLELDPG